MMVGVTSIAGIALAVGAAVCSAVSNLSVRKGTERGRTSDAILVVAVSNVALLFPLVAVFYYPDYGLTQTSLLSFVAAGVLGTLFARAMMFTSINRIGASRTAPIIASWALFSTVLGVVFLGEALSVRHGIGVVLIVVGIAVIAWKTSNDNPEDLSRRELLIGLSIPFLAALAVAWEPIFASVGFNEGTPALVGLVVKSIAATIGIVGYLRWRDELPGRSKLGEANIWWFVVAGVTNTLFLLAYYVALTLAPVNVVTPLIVTNTLFVVILSALVMPERLERVSWRIIAAALVVVTGVVFITVSR